MHVKRDLSNFENIAGKVARSYKTLWLSQEYYACSMFKFEVCLYILQSVFMRWWWWSLFPFKENQSSGKQRRDGYSVVNCGLGCQRVSIKNCATYTWRCIKNTCPNILQQQTGPKHMTVGAQIRPTSSAIQLFIKFTI